MADQTLASAKTPVALEIRGSEAFFQVMRTFGVELAEFLEATHRLHITLKLYALPTSTTPFLTSEAWARESGCEGGGR